MTIEQFDVAQANRKEIQGIKDELDAWNRDVRIPNHSTIDSSDYQIFKETCVNALKERLRKSRADFITL